MFVCVHVYVIYGKGKLMSIIRVCVCVYGSCWNYPTFCAGSSYRGESSIAIGNMCTCAYVCVCVCVHGREITCIYLHYLIDQFMV